MGEEGYDQNFYWNMNIKIRNLEENQRILKEKVILIGKNLIETKEETSKKITGIKKDIQIIKENMEKLTSFLEYAAEDMQKFAKKEDLEMLSKQAKMFQPLDQINKK